MIIERTNNEVIVKLPADMDIMSMDKIVRYVKYIENTRNSKAKQSQADELAAESKKRWWAENKHKYIK